MSTIIVTTEDRLSQLIESSLKRVLALRDPISPSPDKNLLNTDEACKFLDLAKPTIYGLTSKNEIPYIKKGKKLYFHKSELEAWLNQGRRNKLDN